MCIVYHGMSYYINHLHAMLKLMIRNKNHKWVIYAVLSKSYGEMVTNKSNDRRGGKQSKSGARTRDAR